MNKNNKVTFEQAASHHVQNGILSELWDFVRHNRKWWLIPIIVSLLGFGVLIVLSSTGIAPFIYTLF